VTGLERDLGTAHVAYLQRVGASLPPDEAVAIARAVARDTLGDRGVAAIWMSTGAPDLDRLDDLRAAPPAAPATENGVDPETPFAAAAFDLTRREREVLALVCHRLTDSEIGEQLYISRRTASSHVAHILVKLGAENRRAAAALAVQYGVI
jgi:DNA-binding CsgD family transcriptional regulator